MPIIVDLVCHRPEKIASIVRSIIKRRELEFQIARRQALEELRSELKSDVTGLLLSSEMVLKTSNLPKPAADRLNSIIEIAHKMKTLLMPKRQN
ncbi:MAG: hypothetical protein ACXVZV_01795 [Terriglobales bacterium]